MPDSPTNPDRSPFVLLGMSHGAEFHYTGFDIRGSSHVIFCPYFPQTIAGLKCLVGVNKDFFYNNSSYSVRLHFTQESNPEHQAWLDQTFELLPIPTERPTQTEPPTDATRFGPEASLQVWRISLNMSKQANANDEPFAYEILPLPSPPLFLDRPSTVLVDAIWDDQKRVRLGKLIFAFAQPEPLTAEEKRAIASSPLAKHAVVFGLGCKHCNDSIRLYAVLDPSAPVDMSRPESKKLIDATFVEDAPDHWKCKGGHTNFDLTYFKLGYHELFRRSMEAFDRGTVESFKPLYERGQLDNIYLNYQTLINSTPKEEDVQNFLEQHPILWSYLAPRRILFKPKILTKKVADFGIVSQQNILYLIEIEKPQTRLGKKNTAIHSEVNAAFDQVRDWQSVVKKHWTALLDELNLTGEDISTVRYIVIAGLAHETDVEVLTKLHHDPPTANTQFFCFDELASFVHTLAGTLVKS